MIMLWTLKFRTHNKPPTPNTHTHTHTHTERERERERERESTHHQPNMHPSMEIAVIFVHICTCVVCHDTCSLLGVIKVKAYKKGNVRKRKGEKIGKRRKAEKGEEKEKETGLLIS